jgi:hypothetical protein
VALRAQKQFTRMPTDNAKHSFSVAFGHRHQMRPSASFDDRAVGYITMKNLNPATSSAGSAGAGIDINLNRTETCDPAASLAAMQHPEISAAINDAIMNVLQRYSCRQAPAGIQREKSSVKPIVRNNLFVITAVWTVIGLFLLFAAVRASSLEARIAIFSFYGLVQVTLAVFTLIVTSKQVQKVRKRSITLGYLMQGWMALVLCFAGVYLFFQNMHSIGLIVWDTDELEQAVRRASPAQNSIA